jgi:hypothetical protein
VISDKENTSIARFFSCLSALVRSRCTELVEVVETNSSGIFISVREHQKINYSISGLELIALLPLPPAPCSPAFRAIGYFFIWKSLNHITHGKPEIRFLASRA